MIYDIRRFDDVIMSFFLYHFVDDDRLRACFHLYYHFVDDERLKACFHLYSHFVDSAFVVL